MRRSDALRVMADIHASFKREKKRELEQAVLNYPPGKGLVQKHLGAFGRLTKCDLYRRSAKEFECLKI